MGEGWGEGINISEVGFFIRKRTKGRILCPLTILSLVAEIPEI